MLENDTFLYTLLSITIRIAGAAAILFAARKINRWISGRIRTVLQATSLTPSLTTLAITASHYGIWLLAIMGSLIVLGVELQNVLLMAAAVFIVLGIALQQSLRDLAATINFILFKHFEKGDIIETCGITGRVSEIELLNTTIVRGDRKYAVLPNGKIQQEGLINYSKTGILRVDMTVSVSYEDDLVRAMQVIQQLLTEDPRILDDPEPRIIVLKLADSGVDIGVRPYVNTADYWQVNWDTTQAMKLRFDREGITIPYPQRDVHITQSPAG